MIMPDVPRQIESAGRHAGYADTWGHLAPCQDFTYEGHIIFALGAFGGDRMVIDADFEDLPASPWLFQALNDFIGDHQGEAGGVYRFDGTFRNYVFEGEVQKMTLTLAT